MDEIPQAHRLPEDEPLFRKPTGDPTITPDRVSPAIEGYFKIPPIWIGEEPHPASVSSLNPKIHHSVVIKKQLDCGIEAHVQRDGTFLFDFSSWPLAPSIVIPGYKIQNQGQPHRIPIKSISAENKAEGYAVLRAQVINVHQACLTTSERVLKGCSAAMGFPITSWNTYKAINFDTPRYVDDQEDVQALARNVINNKDQIPERQPIARRVLELDVVEHSLELLDHLLSSNETALIQMVEAIYISAYRCNEKRFGEAITLAWGVCEQLLSSLWKTFLDDTKFTDRMPANRKQKLKGRDFTASSITEVLELSGLIDHDLYLLLDATRKSRNKWAHQLLVPNETEVGKAIQTVESLLRHVKGIRLSLQWGGRGGVPQWNRWIWEKVRGLVES